MSRRKSQFADSEIITWFTENICENANGKLQLTDIISKIEKSSNSTLDAKTIGRFIKKIFPNINGKQERSSNDWAKKTFVYKGITWRNQKSSVFELKDIYKFAIGCILIESTDSVVRLGHFTGDIVNGNRVIAEIVFNINKKWSVEIFGEKILLSELGITDNFDFTESSINSIIKTVHEFTFCKGMTEPPVAEGGFFKENCAKVGDENSNYTRYRSNKCDIVLPFINYNKFCYKCSLLLKPAKIIQEKVDNKQDIVLSSADHDDFVEILNRVIPNCPERLKLSQKNATTSHPQGRRWNKDLIRVCLSLWCRSSRGYADLQSSGFVVLSSSRLLQYYKNSVTQESGFNKEILQWMSNEAKNHNLPPEGYKGGILLDEMSIESDLEFSKKRWGPEVNWFH